MYQDYCFVRRCWLWLCRFRKRCGYGIHSPFAFTLVTDVIYNNADYYAYTDILREDSFLSSLIGTHEISSKDLRLLFRLCNQQEAQRIVCIGTHNEKIEQAFRAANSQVKLTWYDAQKLPPILPQDYDLLYVDYAENLDTLLKKTDFVVAENKLNYSDQSPTAPSAALLIVRGIRKNRVARNAWQLLQQSTHCTISFDLYRWGLVYLRPQLQRQDYTICYF